MPDDRRRRTLYLALGCAFVLHNLEEAAGAQRLLAFLGAVPVAPLSRFYQGLSVSEFRDSLVLVTFLGLSIAAAAVWRPAGAGAAYAMLVFAAVLAVNAFGHAASCLVFRSYVPGALTGVGINLPLAIAILACGRRERWVGPPASWTILPAALVVHGPVLLLLLRAMSGDVRR